MDAMDATEANTADMATPTWHQVKLIYSSALPHLALVTGVIVLFPFIRLLYRIFVYPYHVSPLRKLPGPKVSASFYHFRLLTATCADILATLQDHHFLIGQQLNQFRSGSPEEPFKSWMLQWPLEPLIRYFEVGNADAVLVNSLEPYREVLQTKCYSFVRTKPFQRLIGDIIGVGLVFAEGTEHMAQRKVLGGEDLFVHLRALNSRTNVP